MNSSSGVTDVPTGPRVGEQKLEEAERWARRAAQEAPGPWTFGEDWNHSPGELVKRSGCAHLMMVMDPETVLALLAEVREARQNRAGE